MVVVVVAVAVAVAVAAVVMSSCHHGHVIMVMFVLCLASSVMCLGSCVFALFLSCDHRRQRLYHEARAHRLLETVLQLATGSPLGTNCQTCIPPIAVATVAACNGKLDNHNGHGSLEYLRKRRLIEARDHRVALV